MSTQVQTIDDRRGILFTISRDSNPLYQVESSAWAREDNRWPEEDIPQEIRDKMAELEQNGKPGAFVRFLQGEVGVYVICERNIKSLPAPADDDIVLDPFGQPSSERRLSAYDVVIRAKSGAIRDADGGTAETNEGDYYVIPCQTWGRYVLEQDKRPGHVEVTKEMLHLLDELHGHNFLSMSPDKPDEVLPPDIGEPEPAIIGITCYVLNLSRFKR